MARLSELDLKISYSSDTSNLVADFYNPCLQRSCLYRRAVGYFTSTSLSVAAQGITHLLKNGGRIKLIASPILNEDDLKAINEGYENRFEIIKKSLHISFDDIEDKLIRDRLNALAWMIANNALEIKLAIRSKNRKQVSRGIFHEKMGIFSDSFGNHVAFSGSPNETSSGLVENFEAIDVFCSWKDPAGRVQDKINRFEHLWNNQTFGLEVVDFTQAANEIIKRYKTDYLPDVDIKGVLSTREEQEKYASGTTKQPAIPKEIVLRDYQKQAVNNWLKNQGRGIIQFATGTGKTITALAAAITLYKKASLELLVIVCPYRHLVTQWNKECEKFNLNPLLAFESSAKWTHLIDHLLAYDIPDAQTLPVIITTTATFSGIPFQTRLRNVPERTLFLADEVHNLGAEKSRRQLPDNIPWRMGLSATPERWFDETGTRELFSYFGDVLEPKVTLKEALQWGVLTPYYYHPILIPLTDEEYLAYSELTEKIGKMVAMGEDFDNTDSPLQSLLIKRARLTATAQNKTIELERLARSWKNPSHFLVYCGDGTIEDDSQSNREETLRHIDQITRLLGNKLGILVAQYTAETSLEMRESLKLQLAQGEIQGIIAIRCLDEGVDIPSIKTAVILASSTNPRQFIQRRGRILRLSPDKEFATIYDMIVIPPADYEIMEFERNLVKKEISRFIEFADLALNGAEARMKILSIQEKFGLLDM